MKNIVRILICLALGILLAACGQFTLSSPIATPIDLEAVKTSAAATAYVELTEMAAWTPTPTTALTATITPTPTRTATPAPTRPFPTLIPTLELTGVPAKLQTAFSV